MEPVFSWFNFWSIGILSSSMPEGCMGVLGYPKGSALVLIDGTFKLRHCTTLFSMRFLPWSVPRVGYGSRKTAVFSSWPSFGCR